MKLSKAEKERRKEQKIYACYDYWLNRLEKCYLEDRPYTDFRECFDYISAFAQGCYLAGGRKWYNRLNARFSLWMEEHRQIKEDHDARMKEKRCLRKDINK